MTTVYAIYGLRHGEWHYLFTWTRDPDTGMHRAQHDAATSDMHFVAFEARPIEIRTELPEGTAK